MRRGRAGVGTPDEQNRKLLEIYQDLQDVRLKHGDEAAFGSIVALLTCQMAAGSGTPFDALVVELRKLYDDAARGAATYRRTMQEEFKP